MRVCLCIFKCVCMHVHLALLEEWGLEVLLEDERSRLRLCLEEDERALLARVELWGSAGTADGTR